MYQSAYVKPSLFSSLKGLKFSEILDGTQKTLGVINQAIPVIYQVKPVVTNLKNMFKIANVLNEPEIKQEVIQEVKQEKKLNTTNPVFYL